jgi:hypothetical protein
MQSTTERINLLTVVKILIASLLSEDEKSPDCHI